MGSCVLVSLTVGSSFILVFILHRDLNLWVKIKKYFRNFERIKNFSGLKSIQYRRYPMTKLTFSKYESTYFFIIL